MTAKPTFSFYEFNPRRAARGAEAVRMQVFNPDGSIELLWMTERDVRRNMMAFGPCAELDKALAAYGVKVSSSTPADGATRPDAKEKP